MTMMRLNLNGPALGLGLLALGLLFFVTLANPAVASPGGDAIECASSARWASAY